jgi:hypothetical protein
VAGHVGLELANVALTNARANSLDFRNILVPETFREEAAKAPTRGSGGKTRLGPMTGSMPMMNDNGEYNSLNIRSGAAICALMSTRPNHPGISPLDNQDMMGRARCGPANVC